jgi:hypothetical protein
LTVPIEENLGKGCATKLHPRDAICGCSVRVAVAIRSAALVELVGHCQNLD